MELSLEDWHHRYTRQARWTSDLRRYLYKRARFSSAHRILEVGCGTGAILGELPEQTQGLVFGLDLDPSRLRLAARYVSGAWLIGGDAHELPFTSRSFDFCICHFLLLWVTDPERVLAEMVRVTRPGGSILALAEPDYGGRIDYPEPLSRLGDLQQTALRQQGADPLIGRRLAGLFSKTGLESVETGVLGGHWLGQFSFDEWESEWQVLESDLKQIPEAMVEGASGIDLEELKGLDFEARQRGERVLFIPTFYALGRTPG